jgi:hypothetical protein
LAEVATDASELLKLVEVLDPFGEHPEIEGMAQAHDGPYDRKVLGVVTKAGDERSIDL